MRVLEAVIIIVPISIFLLMIGLLIVKFIDNYNEYEPNSERIIVECDEFYYDIDGGSYICSNDLYTIRYKTSTLLDLSKEYQIEAYYVKAHWLNFLSWWSAPKQYQVKRLVVK